MADTDDDKKAHTLADHLLGKDVVHDHDGDSDHDHDHFDFDPEEPLDQNPIWIQDHVTLVSVGIDIGSAGTQIIFSRINLRRYGEDLTSRYYVVSRETLYQSPVSLTPYQSDERIDDAALGRRHRPSLRGRRPRARRHRHRRRHPHRRGAPPRERRGDRRAAGRAARRFRHRHRRPSHGVDARRLRLGRRAHLPRPGASASSTSTSAAAPPSSAWSTTAT